MRVWMVIVWMVELLWGVRGYLVSSKAASADRSVSKWASEPVSEAQCGSELVSE